MKDMDFDKIFDDLLQLGAGLLVGIFRTVYEFIRDPSTFSDSTLRGTRGMLGPLTYFVCAALLFGSEVLIFERMQRSIGMSLPSTGSRDRFIKAFMKLDGKELLKLNAPLILVLAVHAALVKVVFRLLGRSVPFQSVFATDCYFLGTVWLVMALFFLGFIVAFPFLRAKVQDLQDTMFSDPDEYRRKMLLFGMPLSLPIWLLIFKAAHSYFVLLTAVSGTSYWRVFGAWSGGTALLVVLGLLCLGWFWGAFPDEIEKKFNEIGKTDQQ